MAYFVYDISKSIDFDLGNRKKKPPKYIDNVDQLKKQMPID